MPITSHSFRRHLANGMILATIALMTQSCQAEPRDTSMSQQIVEPNVFSTVEVNIEGPSVCTPMAPRNPNWTGITINAPNSVKVVAGRYAVVPICVLAVVPVVVPDPPAMQLIAVDRNTGSRYTGNAFNPPPPEQPDDSVPNPFTPPARTQQEVSGMTAQIMFTTDLTSAVGLPIVGGTFDIHIERGEISSNQVTVEIGAIE